MDDRIIEGMKKAIAEGITKGLTERDIEVATAIADATMNGQITKEQAIDMLKAYAEGVQAISADTYGERTEGYVDITNKIKAALLESGEPGIADALKEVKIGTSSVPSLISPPVAFSCKSWFNIDGMKPEEQQTLWRAIHLAAESEGLWNSP